MKNWVQPGGTLTLVAPYNVVAGAGFLRGHIFAVAAYDALSTEEVEGTVEGVFDLAKVSAQAWTQGALIYWDDGDKVCTTVDAGPLIGVATEAADNPSATGRVRLNGAFGLAFDTTA